MADSLERMLGARPQIVDEAGEGNQIVIARADQFPDHYGDLDTSNPDAYAIKTEGNRVYLLGASELGASHAVAALLYELGFRFYNPSPTWWLEPEGDRLDIDVNQTSKPALRTRAIWYAYGATSKPLAHQHAVWSAANRMGAAAPQHTGHAYGHIIGRNTEAFAAHPEFYAMGTDGKRITERGPNASKFCVSNPDLLKLVAEDRLALLKTNQAANPLEFMVSVDPSDGRGVCQCEPCTAIGTPTDRVIYLANHVARYLKQHDPEAWVGLYAYSTHREPPTIEVEPNVYVQVAMGFNRSDLTLQQLVAGWGEKAGGVGLREYYGVEAWDWGLPGRMRGGQVDYHKQWIPYYHERGLTALNAETNANWGAQTPGGYIASRLMWDPTEGVDPLFEEFYERSFGNAAEPVRRLYALFNEAPQLEVSKLIQMGDEMREAMKSTDDPHVKARLTELMALVHYMKLFRDFSLAWDADPGQGDAFYTALGPVLNFSHRISERDIVHHQALIRRLANGVPLKDGRFEYWYALSADKRPAARWLEEYKVDPATLPDGPVWATGEAYTDQELQQLFEQSQAALKTDDRNHVYFSRYLDTAWAPGNVAGSSSPMLEGNVTAYLASVDDGEYPITINPQNGTVAVTSFLRDEDVAQEFSVDEEQTVTLGFDRANDYRITMTGSFILETEPGLPLLLEASKHRPLTIRNSGPLYFYVPKGVDQVLLTVDGSATIEIPRHESVTVGGESTIKVPEDAAGTLWYFTEATNGTVSLLNVPPLLHLHREPVIAVREVAQSDGLTTVTVEQAESMRWE